MKDARSPTPRRRRVLALGDAVFSLSDAETVSREQTSHITFCHFEIVRGCMPKAYRRKMARRLRRGQTASIVKIFPSPHTENTEIEKVFSENALVSFESVLQQIRERFFS